MHVALYMFLIARGAFTVCWWIHLAVARKFMSHPIGEFRALDVLIGGMALGLLITP